MILKVLPFLLLLGTSLSFPLEEAPLDESSVKETLLEDATLAEASVTETLPEEVSPSVDDQTEEPLVEDISTGVSIVDEETTEEPLTEEPVTEESLTEEPLTEEPVKEEELSEEPAAAEVLLKDAAPEEALVEEEAAREEAVKDEASFDGAQSEAEEKKVPEEEAEKEELETDLCKYKHEQLGLISISYTENEENTYDILSVNPEGATPERTETDQELLTRCLQSSDARESRQRRIFNLSSLNSFRRRGTNTRNTNRLNSFRTPTLSSSLRRNSISKLPRRSTNPFLAKYGGFSGGQSYNRGGFGSVGGIRSSSLLQNYKSKIPRRESNSDVLKKYRNRQTQTQDGDLNNSFLLSLQRRDNKKEDKKRDERKKNRKNNNDKKQTDSKTAELIAGFKDRLERYQADSENRRTSSASNQYSQFGGRPSLTRQTRPNFLNRFTARLEEGNTYPNLEAFNLDLLETLEGGTDKLDEKSETPAEKVEAQR